MLSYPFVPRLHPQKVVEVCKKHFPSLTSSAFSNPKLKIIFADGLEFIRKNTNRFDVIITDSSDNVGVATPLFGEEYYKLMKSALATGGVACSQGKSILRMGEVYIGFSRTYILFSYNEMK